VMGHDIIYLFFREMGVEIEVDWETRRAESSTVVTKVVVGRAMGEIR
jgi:hypothetical protein